MADIGDKGNDAAEVFLRSALTTKKPVGPKPDGYCHFCGRKIESPKRWCDVTCREDWEREENKSTA